MSTDWSDALVEGTLEWAFLQFGDLGQLAELCDAIEYFDDPVEHLSYNDLVERFHRPHAHPERNAVVGRDKGGTIVAYAWNLPTLPDDPKPQVWISMGVHPAWRHQRIRHRLLEWSIVRAEQWYAQIAGPSTAPLWIGCTVDEKQSGITHSLVEAGLQPQRWFFDMHRPLSLDTPIPEVLPTVNVELCRFEPRMSEQVRAAHNEVFAGRAGGRPVGQADWDASLARPGFRADWSWVAIAAHDHSQHPRPDHGRVVGYALNCIYADPDSGGEGWTERLGVCPHWRGHHIGVGLLAKSMRSFLQDGMVSAGIGVDTDDPESMESLFRRTGYESHDRMVLYGRVIAEPAGGWPSAHEHLLPIL